MIEAYVHPCDIGLIALNKAPHGSDFAATMSGKIYGKDYFVYCSDVSSTVKIGTQQTIVGIIDDNRSFEAEETGSYFYLSKCAAK